jgi:anti-sigma B factor antagonist
MTVSERTAGAVVILDVLGSVTLGEGAEQLRDKVRSLLQQERRQILVNLAAVGFMDSAGLSELVQAYATVTRQGGSLKLLHATRRLRDLLVITKLATVFELFDDEQAAVESFGLSV